MKKLNFIPIDKSVFDPEKSKHMFSQPCDHEYYTMPRGIMSGYTYCIKCNRPKSDIENEK
jgi:hypothetical protein